MWWVHNAVVDVVGGEYAGRSGVVVNSGPADGSRVVVKVGDVEAPLTSSQIKARCRGLFVCWTCTAHTRGVTVCGCAPLL
jgi:hypothetical protein